MRDINRDDLSNEDKNYIKTRLKDTAFSSYYSYNSNPEKPSLPANEFKALQDLMNRDDIVIQKADKGNTVVLLNKDSYIVAVESLLDDDTKFAKLNIPPGKDINYIINIENRLRNSYRSLLNNNYIDETTYKKLCPSGSNPGVLYGLAKVHKPCVNGVPKFRPILSAIGTPTYKLAKFLVPKLVSLTINDYTVKDSFSFASEIVQQNPNCYMASFDVNSLFPNIPLHETIDIIINEIESNCIDGIPKKDLKHLHTLATTESIFVFNGVYYKQIDGVAMGSPLGPTLVNIFMCHYENIWLKNCPSEFKPIYYRRYVDDIFVLFESREHVQNFYEYINSRHQNIKFTFEEECDKVLPFLDVCVMREGDSFVTNVYRKPTFSGVYTNFSSFIPMEYKHGLIFSLLYRCYHLCSDLNKFHVEISQLKTILGRNGYPSKVFEFFLRIFKSRNYEPKEQVSLAPKKELFLVLPVLGKITLQIRTRLHRLFKQKLAHCNVKLIFFSKRRLRNCFAFKDRIPESLRSGLVYCFKCSGCNATYYGKTKRHFKVRMSENLGISALTGKRVKPGPQASAVLEHLMFCNNSPASFHNFSVLAEESKDFKLTLMESLLIERDRPILNNTVKSIPLELL
ncbi:uncharacterized protein LOC130622418 [Hydractinia symbiolongicarpus]|uniref:uncharacterized protein LOC130622418 n=1 Tax=Hydractinia symbiolongicarpus TaxID=13093 RepID=UPI00254A2DD8|nr:uncharacterized protein LOC130622418 [Hydractinia symbiolongicarpus]